MLEYPPLGFARRLRQEGDPTSYSPRGFASRARVRGVRNTGDRGSANTTGNVGTAIREENSYYIETHMAQGLAEEGMQQRNAAGNNHAKNEAITAKDKNDVNNGIEIQIASEDKPAVIAIILVDSVINSEKTITDFVQKLRTISPVHIVIIAGALQKESIVEGGNVRELGKNGDVSVVTLKESENKGTGEGATDTGDRPSNTSDMPENAHETVPEHVTVIADSSGCSSVSSSEPSEGSTVV